VVNPDAGPMWTGDGRDVLAKALPDATIVKLVEGDDLTELCERAADDGATVLGMAGGDGSQATEALADVHRQRRVRATGFVPSRRARLDDDRLDVRLVDGTRPYARTRLLFAVLTGTLRTNNAYEEFRTERLEVRALGPPVAPRR